MSKQSSDPVPIRPLLAWAVVDANGRVFLDLIRPTRRAAILAAEAGLRGREEPDAWADLRRECGVSVRKVRIEGADP